MFANHISDKDLVSTTYKQLLQLNMNKTKNPISQWTKEFSGYFSTEDLQMASEDGKRHSASATREASPQRGPTSHPRGRVINRTDNRFLGTWRH